jgi:8-oxo-dGTP pyrophosphatase MutT (NUDIX family)
VVLYRTPNSFHFYMFSVTSSSTGMSGGSSFTSSWWRRRTNNARKDDESSSSQRVNDDENHEKNPIFLCGRLGEKERRRLSLVKASSSSTTSSSSSVVLDNNNNNTNNVVKRAAVLIVLFEKEGGVVHALLTKRSLNMNSHAGQIALPGGKLDALLDDGDDVECALREANEEIGLEREHVEVLTTLPPITSAGFISVRPVVCAVTDAERFSKMEWLRNEPAEVERTFSVRLDAFLKDDPERHTFNDHAWKNAPCAIRVHSFKVDEEEMVETRQKNGSRRNDNNTNTNTNNNRSVGSEKHNKSSSSSTNSSSNSSSNSRTSDCWGLTAAVLIETAKIVFDKEPEFERDCVEGASIWDLVPNKDGSGVELRPGVSKM